jgi:hypothetical protein
MSERIVKYVIVSTDTVNGCVGEYVHKDEMGYTKNINNAFICDTEDVAYAIMASEEIVVKLKEEELVALML